MNIKELKELIHEILRSDITDFELEHTSTKLKLHRGSPADSSNSVVSITHSKPVAFAHSSSPVEAAAFSSTAPESSADDGLHIITSPIVGTFYSSPSPGAEPFIKIGQMVEEGSTLCIVEAMKLLNEIPADIAGEVARIYVENSNPVEYGQKLIGIRPRR